MKILIIRHAEPVYEKNTLTEKGFLEADALGLYHRNLPFDEIYSSPLPRAKLTAEAFLKYHPKTDLKIADWLQEFVHPVKVSYCSEEVLNWDFYPRYFYEERDLFNDAYFNHPWMKSADIRSAYENVVSSFDRVLEKNGYIRNGRRYDAVNSNEKTLIFFCHFGMMSVLLSHLLNIPYVVLCQQFECQPTGITTIVSEEREKGIVQFRLLRYSDITHLHIQNIEPSFHGRFCETFDSPERH